MPRLELHIVKGDDISQNKGMPLKLAHLLNSELKGESRTASPPCKDGDHGLMTPLLSEMLSPHSVKSEDDSSPTGIAAFAQVELVRSAFVLKFPDALWADIMEVLNKTQITPGLTKPEVQLIVHEWYQLLPINYQLLEYECFMRDRRTIHAKIANLEDLYGQKRGQLSEDHIVAFEVCYELEGYLLSDVTMLLPDVLPDDIHALVTAHFPHNPKWLSRELGFINACIKVNEPLEFIQHNLVFRKSLEVKTRVQALIRKAQREDAPPPPAPLTEEEIFRKERIKEFIKSDLTANGLKRYGPWRADKFKIQEIRNVLKEMGGSEAVPFTKLELELVRESLKHDTPMDDLLQLLVFRSEKEVEEKQKKLEIACVRQKRFANDVERLIYEAQWYALMAGESGGRRRRHTRNEVELDDLRKQALVKKEKVVKEFTPEELEEKEKKRALRNQRRAETIRRKEEEKELLKQQRLTRVVRVRRTRKALKEKSSKVSALIEEARWFQSVTGDGKYIKSGEKRKRVPTYHLIPEFQNRQQLKSAQKRLVEKKKQKQSKLRRGRRSQEESSESETDSDADELEELQDAIDSDEDTNTVEVSPFDPVSIMHDTPVPLNSRQLFNESISSHQTVPTPIIFSDDVLVMLQPSNVLPINNVVAAKVIKENMKSYKRLPLSFPPFEIAEGNGKTKVNSRNILHVRYLLYPQHTEQFILATPKSNELDPIFELQKIIEIHYALYFSHSQMLKEVFYEEFCVKLVAAVEEDKFSDFMYIIDKWNALMLELSPYAIEVDPLIDINGSLRGYLPKSYKFEPTVLDLKLDTFYLEVLNAGDSIPDHVMKPIFTPFMPPSVHPVQGLPPRTLPTERFITRYRHLRPATYAQAFISLLNRMTELSRFAVQQLLLRAYTRIVSPDSRKLRCYKAFTAEVYGELLPSFVSEVLTKVGLKPEDKFYDLGSGVGNTTFQAALEFGVKDSGGCEIMKHASKLTELQENFMQKQLIVLGLKPLPLSFALHQSFVENEEVRKKCVDCNILIVNNYLFDFPLNVEVGKLLYGLKPGSKIISLRNFIPPRYKAGADKTIFDYLKVEKFEMSDYLSVSWTANKVPYYISTVGSTIQLEYL
ncbi:CIC11C00000000338 [Sungouiella intermedia]|uniref:Histone-lysine N-methyltransferase, H3 lysine-79 specific n=1 Tax=Sungouiella intermedia TaxID=45354 RepID=A0A1L0BWZ0_9ASCO|nr:CIC11C00000000338 [[Candida] intermedia]